jgi:hypothetical protein
LIVLISPPGFDFTEEIRENIKRSAILAWQSDEYSSRPWCNIELLVAKECLRPIVVVLGIKEGEERSFPYLGNEDDRWNRHKFV